MHKSRSKYRTETTSRSDTTCTISLLSLVEFFMKTQKQPRRSHERLCTTPKSDGDPTSTKVSPSLMSPIVRPSPRSNGSSLRVGILLNRTPRNSFRKCGRHGVKGVEIFPRLFTWRQNPENILSPLNKDIEKYIWYMTRREICILPISYLSRDN